MLKSGLLLLLSLAAINCEIWNEPARKFTTGKEFLYHYDAQILTGIPTSSWHYTGYRLVAQVRLLMKNMDSIRMTLEQIRFLRMNKEISVDEPTVFLPRTLFEEMSEEAITRQIQTQLQRPVQFRWRMGVVSDVQTDVEDLFWSVNMKKALLNLFNMDLTPNKKEDRLKWNGNFFQSLYEDGIEGRCRSVYHWNRLPVLPMMQEQEKKEENNVAITMVKTRDLKDCLETPIFQHALLFSKDCDERRLNVTRDMLKADVTTRANVTFWQTPKFLNWGVNQEFFVWEVKTDARYTFAPVHAKMGSISTFVKQNLTFIEERPLEEKKTDVKMRKEESLQMVVPIPEMMPLKNATEELTHAVFDLLNQIRSHLKERHPRLPTLIKQWVVILRQAPKELLMKVYKECAQQTSDRAEMFELFSDILPSLATKEAVEVLVEKAILSPIAEVADDLLVAGRVRRLGLMNHVVYKEMIYTLIEAAKSPILQKKTQRSQTLKAIIMTVSSLTKTYMDQRKRPELELTTVPGYEEEVPERVFAFLHELLETEIPSLKQTERILVICRALGKVTLPKALEVLTRLMYTETLPLIVRVQCIYALRLYAPERPHLVQQMTLPIFFDVTKDAELRIASYLVVMRTRPSQVLLDSIVESIRREPVLQVQSFVMSHLKNIVESPCHCDCMVVRNISHIVETLRFKEMGVQYSQALHFPLTETETAVIRAGAIFTPEEFVPRSAHMKILTQGSGREMDIVELGLRTEGLQRVLEKLIGPNGKLFTVNKFQELLKTFEPTEILSEVNLAFYMKLFGEEMNFITVTEEAKTLLQEGLNFLPKNFMQFLTGKEALPLNFVRTLFTDAIIRVPTLFGVPFTANMSSIIYMQSTGQVVMKRGIFDEEMIHAEIRVTPTVFTQHLLEAGIDATITKAFTQIKIDAHIPEVKKLTTNIIFQKTGKTAFRIHMEKPEEEWRLIHVNSTMMNVITELRGNWDFSVHQTPMMPKFDLLNTEREPIERTLPLKPIGVMVTSRMNYRWMPQTRYPILYPLRGHFYFTTILRNIDNRREGIELRILRQVPRQENGRGVPQEDKDEFVSEQIFKVQLLKTKMMANIEERRDEVSRREEWTDEERPTNKRLVQERRLRPTPTDEEDDTTMNDNQLIAEAIFMGKRIHKRQLTFRVIFKTGNTFPQEHRQKLTLKGIIILPTFTNIFNKENPLRIEDEKRDESRFIMNCRLVDERERVLLQYKMTFDTDEFAVRFFKRMSDNLHHYRALHPMVKQCYEDLQQKLTNTPACYFTQRYMTMFNRQNYTLIVPAQAPTVIRRVINWIANEKLTFLTRYLPVVETVYPEEQRRFFGKNMEEEEYENDIDSTNRNTERDTSNKRFEDDDTPRNRVEENNEKRRKTFENSDDSLRQPETENEDRPLLQPKANAEDDTLLRSTDRNTRRNRLNSRTRGDNIATDWSERDNENEMETRRPDRFSQFNSRRDRTDKIYHVSFVSSPFDLHSTTINFLLDTVLLRFDNVIVPSMWLNHLHRGDNFYRTVMGVLTQERYPPVCHIHTTPNRAVNVMTFDGLIFKTNENFPMKERRVVLSQDVHNRFQVSAATYDNVKEIQIITRDFSRRVQIIRTKGTSEKVRLLIDGEETSRMPLTLTNEKNQIVLRVEKVDDREAMIRVQLPLLGVAVTTDVLTVVDIEVSIFFHNTLRGVCGDLDGERRAEIKSRDCKKFFVHPEQVFFSKEFTLDAATTRQEPRMLPLKVCKREQVLAPFMERENRVPAEETRLRD